MPFSPEFFWAYQTKATFWATFEKFPLVLRFSFSENAGFGWGCENCHNLDIPELLEPLFPPKPFPVFLIYVHTNSRIMPFAPEWFWAFQTRATFLGDFWKISIGPSFALFEIMRVLCDLAKISLTWPFGHFCSRCFRQELLEFLQFKFILIRG